MGWSSSGIEVYYTPGSPNCRALLMCIKALQLDVELIKLDMYQKFEHRKPWFVKMNPQHTVPTINDNGFVLWESPAIMSYLVNKYGQDDPEKAQLYPQDPEKRALVDRMMYFDVGTLYKSIVDYFHPILMAGEDADFKKENALKTSLDYLDGFLSDQEFIAGHHLTIADFEILASLTQLEVMDYKIQSYKCAGKWLMKGCVQRKLVYPGAQNIQENIHNWMERLKSALPYYHECNDGGLEMFRNWAKSRSSTGSTSAATSSGGSHKYSSGGKAYYR